MRSLFGQLYWEDGFLMWLRLSMNMNVSIGIVLVCSMVIKHGEVTPLSS